MGKQIETLKTRKNGPGKSYCPGVITEGEKTCSGFFSENKDSLGTFSFSATLWALCKKLHCSAIILLAHKHLVAENCVNAESCGLS